MKNFLLFVMLISIVFSATAQKQYIAKENVKASKDIVDTENKNNLSTPVLNSDKSVNEEINRTPVGTAADFRTVRKGDTRTISYNPELDIISITFVMDGDTYGTNDTDIGMIYSTDHGQTWSDPLVIIDNGDDYVNDYPSGIVFNPAGNTTVENAYGVLQDISHVGGDWGYKMWASMTLGGENQDIDVSHNDSNIEDGYWNQYGLTQIDDQVRCLSMLPQGDWGNYQSAELQPIFGDFDGTAFDWDESLLIDMDLYQNTADGQMAWIGSFQGHDGGIDMAWSNDGEIGYMWMVGVTNDELSGYQPLIYMTTDSGESWDFIEIDFLSDEMQTFFDPYIIQATGGLMFPSLVESCGTVDYHGDLQMLFVAGSHSANVLTHPDSLGFSWQYPGDIFNMVVGADGMQDIIWVDSLNTQNPVDDTDGNYAGNGWQHRITVAKNDFENEIFVTWADTRDAENNDYNIDPDLFGWSKNIYTGEQSELISFTAGTLYEKFYYFTYGAEKAYYNEETNMYTVPYVQAITPGEFSTNGTGDPITLNYITGIEFEAIGDYVGLQDLNTVSGISVTQNTPNPFNGTTTISVSSETSAAVVVEVSNIMGQTIYSVNSTVNGTQEIALSSQNMEAGVYFYTVTIGNEKITKKMIVK